MKYFNFCTHIFMNFKKLLFLYYFKESGKLWICNNLLIVITCRLQYYINLSKLLEWYVSIINENIRKRNIFFHNKKVYLQMMTC